MRWLAWRLPPVVEAGLPAGAAGWWALRFTPCVAQLDEALLIEVSSTERLWGGHDALRALLRQQAPASMEETAGDADWAEGPTALQALALLRLRRAGRPVPRRVPDDLPVATLTALRPHASALQHLGCRTWGAVRALPRAGVARRFGAACLEALDQAWGEQPLPLEWLQLPERFGLEVELPARAESAEALLWTGRRLLDALQSWLRARHQGVLALEVAWHYDLRRIDGVELPAWQRLELRTAQAVQSTAHLRRLLAERLARERLAAPADRLALRSLQTAALAQQSASFLPPVGQEQPGEPWHQLIERLTARLGPQAVQVPEPVQDHRPERMQRWHPPVQVASAAPAAQASSAATPWPAWLVRPPRPLALLGSRPCLLGQPLRLLAGPQRLESGWWEAEGEAEQGLVQRDYFVAHAPEAGWVWVFRDRTTGGWFLQGVYA